MHLESIRQYEFGKYIEKRIPLIKESIKKRVIKEVNEWLTGYVPSTKEANYITIIRINISWNEISLIIFSLQTLMHLWALKI